MQVGGAADCLGPCEYKALFTSDSPNMYLPRPLFDHAGVGGGSPQMTNLKILDLIENYYIVNKSTDLLV